MIITVSRTIAGPIPVTGILASLRRVALAAISTLVTASTLTAFAESFRALFLWALRHGVPFGWALVWPVMIDVFIAVGELALFVGLVDHWPARARILPWCVTVGGIAASVAANVGHVSSHVLTVQLTASVPPLAAAVSLMVAMAVLKRVVQHRHQAATVPAANTPQVAVEDPSTNEPLAVVRTQEELVQPATELPQAVAPTAEPAPNVVPIKKRSRKRAKQTIEERASDAFGDAIFNGADVPSVRAVQTALKCSWPNAQTAHAHLTEMHQLRTHQLVTAGR